MEEDFLPTCQTWISFQLTEPWVFGCRNRTWYQESVEKMPEHALNFCEQEVNRVERKRVGTLVFRGHTG
jgi:hypothetical protein